MSDQAEVEQSAQDRMESLIDAGFLTDEPEEKAPKEEASDGTEEVESEEVEGDSEEEQPETGTLKLTHNGEEIEVPIAEAKALAQQGYDYTQKTQRLAEERKAVEMQVQAIKAQEQAIQQQAETQQALIKEIAQVTSIDNELARYQAVDWNAISESDPVQTQKLWIQYQQLQNTRAQALNGLQQKHGQLEQQRALNAQAQLEKAKAELLQAFPNWSDETAKELRDTGKSHGFTDAELSGITDPRMVKVLADATAYRKLQASKGNVSQKVQGKPAVVKPGSKDTQTASRSKNVEMRQQLHKTGDQHLAAKLIERML